MFGLFRVKRRLEALENDFLKLTRDFQGLELEWVNVYSKLKKIMGRIVKSEAIMAAQEEKLTPGPEEPTSLQPGPGVPHGFLTSRQREIQQVILRRRAGGGNSGLLHG